LAAKPPQLLHECAFASANAFRNARVGGSSQPLWSDRQRGGLGAITGSLGFYEAEFVKAPCENSFLFILIHFGRRLATNHLLGFGA
jgi:hypothetical protein